MSKMSKYPKVIYVAAVLIREAITESGTLIDVTIKDGAIGVFAVFDDYAKALASVKHADSVIPMGTVPPT